MPVHRLGAELPGSRRRLLQVLIAGEISDPCGKKYLDQSDAIRSAGGPGRADWTHVLRGAVRLRIDSDRKGMLIAGLCFIHCVAGPAVLGFAGFASVVGVSEKIEPVFLLSSLVFGAAALVPAYRKRHGRLSCLVLFAGGIACLLFRRRLQGGAVAEWARTGIGAALIIGAHALNLRFSKRCPCCAQDDGKAKQRIELWK
jgi:MerC mercury resistance protein